MAPIPADRFARLFRGLGSEERVAFVAALWAERGWESTMEGTTVVATRGVEQRRIRVVDPGRFGTPELTDVDVLVAARDRDAVRATARAAGARHLSPADVRDELLYGMERDAAAALFERTFQRPLDAGDAEPTPEERIRSAGTTLVAAVPTEGNSRPLLALLLVGLLVGAAIGVPALTSEPDDSTAVVPVESVTPGDVGAVGERAATATPEEGEPGDDRPPGLGERTLEDHVALADAHAEAVMGRPRTLTMVANGSPSAPVLRGRQAWNATARIEHPRRYLHDVTAHFPAENGSTTFAVSIYADGDTKFRRAQQREETTYQRYALETTGDASGFATESRAYLLRFLDGDSSRVDCVATLAGDGDCFAHRVVVTGAPPAVHENATDYRAVAVVQDDGVVVSLHVSYTVPVDGEAVPVRFTLTYDGIGDTTVSPPDWLETAKNATSG